MPENSATPPTQPPASPPPPASLPPGEKDARMWAMLCHLSGLFFSVLGPLLIWQIKKNEIPSIEVHGKAAVNFQLTILIGIIGSMVLGVVLTMLICIGFVFFIVAWVIGLCGAIFAIIACIKANEGKEYKYPYSLDLIK